MGIVNEKSSTTSLYLCSNTFVLHLEPHVLHVGFFYASTFGSGSAHVRDFYSQVLLVQDLRTCGIFIRKCGRKLKTTQELHDH